MTESVVDPETVPEVAEMAVDPTASAVASPADPAALLMVATLVVDELQVAVAVTLLVEASE